MANILDERTNPALGEILSELRSTERQADRQRFRTNMALLGTLLGYEIGASLASDELEIATPLGSRQVAHFRQPPILATALRAGLPFLDGMLKIFRGSDAMFFGAARAEGAGPDDSLGMQVDLSYRSLTSCEGRDLIFVDPMVATGSTVIDIHRSLVSSCGTPSRFIVAGLVGFRGAIDRLEQAIPGVEVWYVTCDETLDERGYIVPGLGDAGDLCYGAKL